MEAVAGGGEGGVCARVLALCWAVEAFAALPLVPSTEAPDWWSRFSRGTSRVSPGFVKEGVLSAGGVGAGFYRPSMVDARDVSSPWVLHVMREGGTEGGRSSPVHFCFRREGARAPPLRWLVLASGLVPPRLADGRCASMGTWGWRWRGVIRDRGASREKPAMEYDPSSRDSVSLCDCPPSGAAVVTPFSVPDGVMGHDPWVGTVRI